ncbi:GreA/GreB family elongation factor [Kiritimatiella glycovorans]|uniref:Transcription elongation factor GreA n=1 Tax=Kiritimatiella glycovorans TaxID=1307763 RepID=A0A0G3EI99_9BACT|nr:GreA/GreB family elongation factor [Kiritimatiella glycovorans]AKJ64540.1 Transcript cleavage factor GreA [Kiritimatiella glycovorans]
MDEAQFLAQLESEEKDAAALLDAVRAKHEEGDPDTASDWSDLLLDTLAEQGAIRDAAETLRWQVCEFGRYGDRPEDRVEAVRRLFARHHRERKLVEAAGFESIPPAEAFRRLFKLWGFESGSLCYDRTWGLGRIERVDDLYRRVVVEFESQRDEREVPFEQAAERLEPVSEDHLYTLRERDPDELRRMIRKEPLAVLKRALAHFGPSTQDELGDALVPVIIEPGEWKSFIDRARAAAREDPLVDWPQRREEPIRVRREARSYDRSWFEEMAEERDAGTLLDGFEAAQARGIELDERMRAVAAERLGFVMDAARGNATRVARAALIAAGWNLEPERPGRREGAEELNDPDALTQALEGLPVKRVREFLDWVTAHGDSSATGLADLLNRCSTPVLNELVPYAVEHGAGEACAARIREELNRRTAAPGLLYWLLRNSDRLEEWNIASRGEFAFLLLDEIGSTAARPIREAFQDPEWLARILEEMPERRRSEFVRRISRSSAWSTLDRNAVLGKIVKARPELHQVILDEQQARRGEAEEVPVTSIRSYRAREEEYRDLVQRRIPENAREIEHARSYGDLRENAEYKAAKERQRLLAQRVRELESMLDRVKPTDFSGYGAEKAGTATVVELGYSGGRRDRYIILGCWDGDEERGIISSQTALAQALEGHGEGENVRVPGEEGEIICRLVSVKPLPADILEWVKGKEPDENG